MLAEAVQAEEGGGAGAEVGGLAGVVEGEEFAEAPEVVETLADVLRGYGGADGIEVVFGEEGCAGVAADGLEDGWVVGLAGLGATKGGEEGGGGHVVNRGVGWDGWGV